MPFWVDERAQSFDHWAMARAFRSARLVVLFAGLAAILLAAAPSDARAQDDEALGDNPALEGEDLGYEIWDLSRHDADLRPEVRRAKMRRIAAHIFYESFRSREDQVSLARRELKDPYWPDVLREELSAELDRLEAVMLDDPTKLRDLARQELEAIRRTFGSWISSEHNLTAGSLYGILDIMEDHAAQHEWVTFQFWLEHELETYEFDWPRQRLWRLAAKKDYLPAIIDLAGRYRTGEDFSRDPAKAYFWYVRASGRGIKVRRHIDDLVEELSFHDYEQMDEWQTSETGAPPP